MRKAFLSGNIGKEPEMFAPDGSEWSCLKFSIANNEESRKVNDEWEHVTSWYDLEYWTKKPHEWLQKLTKGRSISVECEVKQQTWEQDGNNRSRILFIVKGWPEVGELRQRNNTPGSSAPSGGGGDDSDIPF